MSIYLKPLFFSFLPSIVILLLATLASLNPNSVIDLLLGKECNSIGFRLLLIAIEIFSYITLVRYYSWNKDRTRRKTFWNWFFDTNNFYNL